MRGRMSDVPSYAAQVAIGAVMVGGTAGHLVGISQAGRSGGRLPRDIGTQDELKRANERPVGKTRVKKADEEDATSG